MTTESFNCTKTAREIQDFLRTINSEIIDITSTEDVAIVRTQLLGEINKFPVRPPFGFIALIDEGEAEIEINLEKFNLKPSTLLQLGPSNYMTGMKIYSPVKVTLFTFNPVLLESLLPKMVTLIPEILTKKLKPVFHMNNEERDTTGRWLELIEKKMKQEPTPFIRGITIGLLYAFMMEITQFQAKDTLQFAKPTHREGIVARFLKCVSENFKTERRVEFYADKMCISSKHLSAVVKEVTGKTASEWIDIYVILEAKVLLHTTSLSIQQISGRLNFANQSFFGKYFKRLTGKTPTEFRC